MNHLLMCDDVVIFCWKRTLRGIDVEIQELIVDAHHNVYYLVKIKNNSGNADDANLHQPVDT